MSEDSISAITSRAEFRDAVGACLDQAAAAGAREIFMIDPSFADWPLNDAAVVDTLARWAKSTRSLTLMAHRYEELPRRHMRFVEWRRNWSHVVRCRADEDLEEQQIPTLLLVPGLVCLRMVDNVNYRGTMSGKSIDLVTGRETVDALLQRSSDAFPVTALGL
jgi:hypothetical protein